MMNSYLLKRATAGNHIIDKGPPGGHQRATAQQKKSKKSFGPVKIRVKKVEAGGIEPSNDF